MTEYYDYDPKMGQGDGGIEFRAIGSKTVAQLGKTISREEVEVVPFDGTEGAYSINKQEPTFSIDHPWHNRPA